jgi:hypothetical protein
MLQPRLDRSHVICHHCVSLLDCAGLHRASAAGDNTAQQPTGDPFEFFSRLQSPDLSEKLEEGMARMVCFKGRQFSLHPS